MTNCAKCGMTLNPGDKFCGFCRTPVPAAPVVQPRQPKPVAARPPPPTPPPRVPRGRSHRKRNVGGAILVVVLLLFAFAVFFPPSQNSPSTGSAPQNTAGNGIPTTQNTPPPSTTQATLPASATGVWPLCDQFGTTATDYLSSGSNLSLTGGPMWVGGGSCGLDFSGADYATGNTTGFPAGDAPRSVGVKFSVASLVTGTTQIIFYYGQPSASDAFYLLLINQPSGEALCVGQWGGGDAPCTPYSIELNQPNCAVATFDGTTVNLYVNDTLAGSATRLYVTTLTSAFYLGGAPGLGGLDGNVYSAAFYGQALSASDVADFCSTPTRVSGASSVPSGYSLVSSTSPYFSFLLPVTWNSSNLYHVNGSTEVYFGNDSNPGVYGFAGADLGYNFTHERTSDEQFFNLNSSYIVSQQPATVAGENGTLITYSYQCRNGNCHAFLYIVIHNGYAYYAMIASADLSDFATEITTMMNSFSITSGS